MIEFDFDSIANRIIENLRKRSEWADISFWSTNRRLIDAIAEELSYISQYNEILALESKWGTAREISSLLAQVPFFGYKPHRKIGSRGLLKVGISADFTATHPFPISIPAKSLFMGGGLVFTTIEAQEIPPNASSAYIEIIQGEPKTFQTIALGNPLERFVIQDPNIENSTVRLFVNNIPWVEYEHLPDIPLDEQGYVVRTLPSFQGVVVQVGNESFGTRLNYGDIVRIEYLVTKGSQGNVGARGVIKVASGDFRDSNNQPVVIYCTNDDPILGGSDEESIESIRINAPRSLQTGGRIISKSDYLFAVQRFYYILRANVWGAQEINEDNNNPPDTPIPSQDNVVNICVIKNNLEPLSAAEEQEIRQYINDKKSVRDIVRFVQPNILYTSFNVTAYISSRTYSLLGVSTAIKKAIEEKYKISNRDFKENLYHSDYTALIDNVDGVEYHNTVLSIYKLLTFSSAYTTETSTGLLNLQPNSVSIFVRNKVLSSSTWTLVATDNGSGVFTAQPGYNVSGSTVNYSTGVIVVVIQSGLTAHFSHYEIKVQFNLVSSNVLLTGRNQIICHGDIQVTTLYI